MLWVVPRLTSFVHAEEIWSSASFPSSGLRINYQTLSLPLLWSSLFRLQAGLCAPSGLSRPRSILNGPPRSGVLGVGSFWDVRVKWEFHGTTTHPHTNCPWQEWRTLDTAAVPEITTHKSRGRLHHVQPTTHTLDLHTADVHEITTHKSRGWLHHVQPTTHTLHTAAVHEITTHKSRVRLHHVQPTTHTLDLHTAAVPEITTHKSRVRLHHVQPSTHSVIFITTRRLTARRRRRQRPRERQ